MLRMTAGAVLAAALALPPLAAADILPVHLVSQNQNTITLGWTPQTGYGYLFSADGTVVSRTNDAARGTVKFSKGPSVFEVAVIVKGATGTYPTAPPPPPPPPPGNTLEFSGTVSSSTFTSRINAAPPGDLTVRPASGQTSFTVTGDFTLGRRNVTIQKAVLGDVTVGPTGSGFTVEDSQVHSFLIDGANDWTIQRDLVDFQGVTHPGQFNGGSIMYRARNWRIVDSTFTRAYVTADPSQHTEAWFIGCGNQDGLIQNNRFDDNGTTGHLFFSWWDCSAGQNDPRNICVTANAFTRSHNPYHQIDMRAELNPATNNIDIDRANTTDGPAVAADSRWVRSC